MNGKGVKVGQRILVHGQWFWITKVTGVCLEVMPDPDDQEVDQTVKKHGFWSTFFVIILIAIILKMLF